MLFLNEYRAEAERDRARLFLIVEAFLLAGKWPCVRLVL